MLRFAGQEELDPSKTYLVMVKGDGCSASTSLEEVLDGMDDLPVEVVKVTLSEVEAMFSMSTPWLWLYRGGEAVDGARGAIARPSDGWRENNARNVRHLLARNGVGEVARPPLWTFHDPVLQRRGNPRGGFENHDASNLDMRGFDFDYAVLSGSVFRGADLSGADLSDTLVIHADFTGANLDGADLLDAYWKDVICPDGRLSDETNFSCQRQPTRRVTPTPR